MKKLKHYLLATMMLLVFGSCIHEYPNPDTDPNPDTPITIDMIFTFNISFGNYLTQNVPVKTDPLKLRYIIEVYDDNNTSSHGELVERYVATLESIDEGENKIDHKFDLEPIKYKILIWVDWVDDHQANDKHYVVPHLKGIKLTKPYVGSVDTKDAFRAMQDIDLTEYRGQTDVTLDLPITLERPFAKVELVTTDVKKYLEKARSNSNSSLDKITVKVIYPGFFPCGYNVATLTPNDSEMGFSHTSTLSLLNEEEALLAFDYIFVNGSSTSILVDMVFYDDKQVVINQVSGVNIPIQRGLRTVVKDKYLTKDFKPGINVNPDYDGPDIVVVIPD